jgi:hypothetical protein
MKRVVVISDLHCGHETGLTHPDWNPPFARSAPHYKIYRLRRKLWQFYTNLMEELQPIDVLIVNGDATEGKGPKSGARGLLTADRIEQADMATAAIEEAKAGEIVMSYGTPYHTGNSEQFEKLVAKGVKARAITNHGWHDVNGVIFDYRHFISRSSIPHGRYTPLARERLWNIMQAEHEDHPKAKIVLRSHVHYFAFCGGFGWLGVITPALQAHTEYGETQVSGTVDFGAVWFDVEENGEYSWDRKILKLKGARHRVLKAK